MRILYITKQQQKSLPKHHNTSKVYQRFIKPNSIEVKFQILPYKKKFRKKIHIFTSAPKFFRYKLPYKFSPLYDHEVTVEFIFFPWTKRFNVSPFSLLLPMTTRLRQYPAGIDLN